MVGNLLAKFGHARPLGSRIIRMYATDGQTDKSNAYCPLLYGAGGIINSTHSDAVGTR